MSTYKEKAHDLSKKAEVLSGYIKDHAETMGKLADQLADLARDIDRYSDEVSELENQKTV